MSTVVLTHIDELACTLHSIESCLAYLFGRTHESYHRTIGSVARVHIEQFHTLMFLNLIGDLFNDLHVASLAKVGHALNNLCLLAHSITKFLASIFYNGNTRKTPEITETSRFFFVFVLKYFADNYRKKKFPFISGYFRFFRCSPLLCYLLLCCYTFNLYECTLGQIPDGKCAASRVRLSEELTIHLVHSAKVGDVGKEYGGLHHVC